MNSKISKEDICCIIITYHPDDNLKNLLEIIQHQVDKIVIVDNTDEETNCQVIKNLHNIDKLSILSNNKNKGIAKALNQGVHFAKIQGYNWAITFDQDTKPFEFIIDILLDIYSNFPYKNKIGAIGVNAIDDNDQKYFKIQNKLGYNIRDYLITSGTLISLDAFIQIGGFCEELFIDNVDLEYSLKLKKNGYYSLISTKCGMQHKPGNYISKNIFGLRVESSNHSSFRRYFMSRNNFFLTKKYILLFPYFILKMNFFYILDLVKMILVEKNRNSKIKSTLKGTYDGLFFKNLKNYEL